MPCVGQSVIHAQSLSCVWLFATPWTVAPQTLQSMGFSRQEYWSGLPFPSPGDLPSPGIEPASPAFVGELFTTEPPGKPLAKVGFSQTSSCLMGQMRSRTPPYLFHAPRSGSCIWRSGPSCSVLVHDILSQVGKPRDFPGGPVVKPSKAEDVGPTPGQGAKIPHAPWPKTQNIKQKRYCYSFNKDFQNGP